MNVPLSDRRPEPAPRHCAHGLLTVDHCPLCERAAPPWPPVPRELRRVRA
ncbi:hypothetical protein [Deinococcus humi]|uniref:Uncharacterized protein n=1 Tax=Deinococcus humi TaxID=662880 RepID=A0A7W8JQG7_9DEIO|nr:hypothetical protein [Deinococcus humi]MBB5361347.1 hypothetical protein [Deinococcus humi]